MTCGELIKYLQEHDPEETVSIVVADLNERISYTLGACYLIEGEAAIWLEVAGSEPLDDEEGVSNGEGV